MKLAAINKAATPALNLLKAEGLKTRFLILRASIEDLKAERNALRSGLFHLECVEELCDEILSDSSISLCHRTRAKLTALQVACAEEIDAQ